MLAQTAASLRHLRAGAILLALAPSFAASVLAQERITMELWLEAQAEAARLSDNPLYDAASIHIEMAPIERVQEVAGDRSVHACVYVRAGRVLYCRDDRPWQSDRAHHFGIIIHEAAHSLQPDGMPSGCREAQAHAVQIAWLLERGKTRRAAEVARNAARYACEETWRWSPRGARRERSPIKLTRRKAAAFSSVHGSDGQGAGPDGMAPHEHPKSARAVAESRRASRR